MPKKNNSSMPDKAKQPKNAKRKRNDTETESPHWEQFEEWKNEKFFEYEELFCLTHLNTSFIREGSPPKYLFDPSKISPPKVNRNSLCSLQQWFDDNNWNDLHKSVYFGQKDWFAKRINEIDINEETRQGKTTLMIAMEFNRINFALNLIQRGATINKRDQNGFTATNYLFAFNEANVINDFLLWLQLWSMPPNSQGVSGASASVSPLSPISVKK